MRTLCLSFNLRVVNRSPIGIIVKLWMISKGLVLEFAKISWHHIYKEANFVADALAHVDLSLVNPHFWDYCLPHEAMIALRFDSRASIRGFRL